MALLTGRGGAVDFSVAGQTAMAGILETNIAITSWSLNINRNLVGVSAFGDDDTKFVSNIGGQLSATATVSGVITSDGAIWQPQDIPAIGAEGKIELSVDGTDTYTFTGIVTGSSHNVNRSGDATWTLNIIASGAVVDA